MPELPEVETVKRGLQRLLPKRRIKKVKMNWYKSFLVKQEELDSYVVGSRVISVKRRGKVLIIELDSKYSLLIHLKMTGQLVIRGEDNFGAGHPTDSLVGELPDKSTRVIFIFDDGSRLFFNDQRKFGWIKLLLTTNVNSFDFIKKLGPEPLGDKTTSDIFIEQINKRQNSGVKAVLLDQSIIAGIGNIYADEALFLSGIHPSLRIRDISTPKKVKLFNAIREVLQLSIDNGGSSDRNYVDAQGNKGSYLGFAKVFRREGLPCLKCSRKIVKIRVAGRGTHICLYDQKLPKGYK